MKIQYVITIHLMWWLTNFYDFRFEWTATAAIGIHPTKPDSHSWWISKMQSGRQDTLEKRYAIKLCFKLGNNAATETHGMLQTAFEPSCRNRASVFERHKRFKEGRESVRDDERCGRRKKSIDQSWLAKGLGLGLLCWGFKGVQQRIPREETSTLQIQFLALPIVQTLLPVTCLFPKLTGCRYETIEEMSEAVTKVIDTLTQEDFHGAFQKLLERYNKCIAAGGDYFEGDLSFMCVLSIKVPIRKKTGILMILVYIYIYMYVYPTCSWTLHVYVCGFQITHGVKQCTTG